jgi:protein gp37
MGSKTGISWTDSTWSCVRGCSRVSPGCEHCYAEQIAGRFSNEGAAWHGFAERKLVTLGKKQHLEGRWTRKVELVPSALTIPLKWRTGRRIFVNSTSDTFHEKLSNEDIAAIFGVMAACPQHRFQVLTKRAKRMYEWFEWLRLDGAGSDQAWDVRAFTVWKHAKDAIARTGAAIESSDWNNKFMDAVHKVKWPLENVELGVSTEDQDAADERIPWLLKSPAAFRFVSAEPLLGPIDFHAIQIPDERSGLHFSALQRHHDDRYGQSDTIIDLIIAGCESGRGARKCDVRWLRSLRDQCSGAGVKYFLKQAVDQPRDPPTDMTSSRPPIEEGIGSKRKGGGVIELPYLDGVQHAELPQ